MRQFIHFYIPSMKAHSRVISYGQALPDLIEHRSLRAHKSGCCGGQRNAAHNSWSPQWHWPSHIHSIRHRTRPSADGCVRNKCHMFDWTRLAIRQPPHWPQVQYTALQQWTAVETDDVLYGSVRVTVASLDTNRDGTYRVSLRFCPPKDFWIVLNWIEIKFNTNRFDF